MAFALATVLATGCRHPHVQTMMEHDRASTQWVLDSYAARERSNPARLRGAFAVIEHQLQKDARDTPENIAGADAFFQKDVKDWPRHARDIRQELIRQFEGDPEMIAWTLPRLAF